MNILGIETSADDTGIALISAEGTFLSGTGSRQFKFDVLGNGVSLQTIHAEYGGIFPAMAKREHKKNLPILFERIMSESKIDKADVIAVTHGPGLEPCLWTGITFAQELAKKWNVPIVGVNHMEGHIVMSMSSVMKDLGGHSSGELANFEFPAIALLISGGHTELVLMEKFGQYKLIGKTRDDAVGEAYDKVARMLGLEYPGGPAISKLAEEARAENLKKELGFPRPMMKEDNLDFSFSGLKTAVLRFVTQCQGDTLTLDKKEIARGFEDAVVQVLIEKTVRAIEEYGANTIVLGGGVSANKHIRRIFAGRLAEIDVKLLVCLPEFSTDNALMITLAGYFHALKNEFIDPEEMKADGNLRLS